MSNLIEVSDNNSRMRDEHRNPTAIFLSIEPLPVSPLRLATGVNEPQGFLACEEPGYCAAAIDTVNTLVSAIRYHVIHLPALFLTTATVVNG